MKLNPNKTALTVGTFVGLWHFVWGLLVTFGFAQILLDFIYGIHFMNNPFTIQPFDLIKWITLVVVTTIVGYIFGYIFTIIWNKVQKQK
ncbi:MAG: hypothetical protein UT54_C0037G0008 [Candidatus Daviesbacteria bacterium GW2011_GWB1_39_5]|nr:MAG: hypothetical protein UT54_C0037G0008 [Candidatus Daviesbacteria bacterium GW2011_GWB1_39_5]OGE22058.1 MAG: hypothetical protein A2778_01960 [Candidatus Daviesbacteria bacterium RIFCSPHIGHO2_01_FULL_40_24]OGE28633.1 MAG: hypothetical protein A3C29_03490 [Candidatus Daviesbacteria bacterium RIFCSPHIGHO2_02_FULL_40_16]OGE42957.1 MAG: hypothetical protein A3A53_06550 [Candidatus Daviesbacteria bacterium RIFCSPLOWO2_01_FULL_39_23]OGE66391.1 MAG: hypothetical protein A3J16_05380 [Candidatus D